MRLGSTHGNSFLSIQRPLLNCSESEAGPNSVYVCLYVVIFWDNHRIGMQCNLGSRCVFPIAILVVICHYVVQKSLKMIDNL